jgi:hypothetical protein
MAKLSKPLHQERSAPFEPARRIARRRATADRRPCEKRLTVKRIRQILAAMLESREIDPPAGFIQLQIARHSEAMIAARTMMWRAICRLWID